MDEIHDIIYRTANLVPTKCGTRGKKGRRKGTRRQKTQQGKKGRKKETS